jgi:hypothetical protein
MTKECEVCGGVFPVPYLTETWVGEGDAQECITHCRENECWVEEDPADAAERFGYTPSGDDIVVPQGTPAVPTWVVDKDIPF